VRWGLEMTVAQIDLQGWYNTTVTKLNLEPHEMAMHIWRTTERIPFTAALDWLQIEQQSLEEDVAATTRVIQVVNQTNPCYFLTVKGFMVQVAYGVKWCGHIQEGRQNLVTMLGDWRRVSHTIRGPMFMRLSGTYQEQQETFGSSAYVTTMELPDIIEGLSEPNHQGSFVISDDDQEVADPTVGWRVLPVHPKIAVLFLRGMTVLAAAKLVQEMWEQVPEDEEEKMTALVDFLRIACTTTDADEGSRAGVEWEPVHQESDQVFEWCRGLQNQYFRLSEWAASTALRERAVVPVAAVPPTENNHREYMAMIAAAMAAANDNAGGTGKKSKFSQSFVEEYAEIAGIEDPDPCDSSIMTVFYRGLEEHKGNKAAARKHIEKCFGPKASGDPDAPREMTSVLSTETISAFRNFDLTADDTFVAFDERLKGISVFSLAPAPVHLVKRARESRAKCMEHELADYQK
jgi:hypothetical protein